MNKKIILSKICGLVIIAITMLFFIKITVKASYEEPDNEFRAVWVTPWGGDSALVSYTSEANFKANMNYVLTIMEEYNMNVLIYHIRTHNNALYNSEINPLASYWSSVNFGGFDPLTWLIEACHVRGIEFHAWLNPYRVSSSYSGTIESFASTVQSNNIASDASNLLKTAAGGIILNPAKAVVRDFIIQTVAEIMDRYNVDAIHFDDYFYANMGANGATSGTTTIISEPDQSDYEAYIDSNPVSGYLKTSATNKADWRREQVDLLISGLSTYIKAYNETNTRYVQLGIAPTGIYKNGNGIVTYNAQGEAITTGSNTSGQTHYSSYLFCDTLKWCNEGWIDYILPQSYWGMTHTAAGYQKVMGWWDKVVKNLDVNLYSGIGLYMADEASNTYSWKSDDDELLKQLTYLTTLENVQGASIYNFNNLRKRYDGGTSQVAIQLANLGVNCWTRKVVVPEIKSMEPVNLSKVTNFNVVGNTLTWGKTTGSKFYAIYRSSANLSFASSEIIDIVGGSRTNFTWTDSDSGTYSYGIAAISYTNTIGTPTEVGETQAYSSRAEVVADLIADYNTTKGTSHTLQYFIDYTETGYGYFASVSGDNTFFSNESMRTKWSWLLEYLRTIRTSSGLDVTQYNSIINKGFVTALAATINVETIAFIAGKQYTASSYSSSDYSLAVNNNGFWAFSPRESAQYTVSFVDYDGTILKTENVASGEGATAPTSPTKRGYVFSAWDVGYANISNHTTVTATYNITNSYVNIKTNNAYGTAVVTSGATSGLYVDTIYDASVTLTATNGTGDFLFWLDGDRIVSFNSTYQFNVTSKHEIAAYFTENGKFGVAFVDLNMRLIDFVSVAAGAEATTTKVPRYKPGYTFTGFAESSNITANKICYANYDKQEIYFTVSVVGGLITDGNQTSKNVVAGTVVTITSSDENFKYWTHRGKIVSYERTYSFSAYENSELVAINTGTLSTELFVNIATPFIDGSDSIGFIVQIENIGIKNIVEYGFIYIYGAMKNPLEDSGAIKIQALVKAPTNEYSLIANVNPSQTINVIGYVIIKNDGVYHSIYSELVSYTNNQ